MNDVHRPRTIVTADPELDDLNSMIRLVLFSNELQIEGLVYASSRYHWKGDGAGTLFFRAEREYAEPCESWRWSKGERFIDDVLDAYAVVHENLRVHDPRYPSPEHLRSVVREGNVVFEGDLSEESPGSRLIAETLLDDRPGPVFLQVWAGTSTIARALLSIEEAYRGDPDWSRVKAAVSAKAVITKFDSQDDTYNDYIRPHWPDLRVVDVATWTWGYSARHLVLPGDRRLLEAEWMRSRITSTGPLGALYRTWGDGRRMVEDDPTDFFHLSGVSADALGEQGYQVWTEPQHAGEWISEGDSTNMLVLVPPGLRSFEHPSYGGWGGRAERTAAGVDEWSVQAASDDDGAGGHPPEYSVSRWFGDAQRDFAARLRWSVTPVFDDADHPPVIASAGLDDRTVGAGERVTLTASVRALGGGGVRCHWWLYREAGTLPGDVLLEGAGTASVIAQIPHDAGVGQTVHLILEARNDDADALISYRRVILTVGSPNVEG